MRKATKDPKDLKIPFSVGISPVLAETVDRMAREMDRSRSWLTEKLLLRGLALYRQDGILEEPADLFSENMVQLRENTAAAEKEPKKLRVVNNP